MYIFGWDNEPKIYESMFQEIYVKRIKFDNEIINELIIINILNIRLLNHTVPSKNTKICLEGLYIKQKSIETIQSFILEKH